MAKSITKTVQSPPQSPPSIIRYQTSLPNLNREPWTAPTVHIKKKANLNSYEIIPSRRPCGQQLKYIETLRAEVEDWRNASYPNVSKTSQDLLHFWFNTSHIVKNENFNFRFAQREAIETLIYLYEYKNLRNMLSFFNQYPKAKNPKVKNPKVKNPKTKEDEGPFFDPSLEALIKDASKHDLTRYCAKAATGSGKTFLMAFVAVWSYFHKKREAESPLSKNILLIAPNVIVYDRLKKDFVSGQIFNDFPFIPDAWRHDWRMAFQMRDQSHRPIGDGAIFLSNIHQLYASRLEEDTPLIPANAPYSREDGANILEGLLGKKVKKGNEMSHWQPSILDQIIKLEELLVINDEAHHVHEKELQWYQSIIEFQNQLKAKNKSISLLYELSATPKNQNGNHFPWIISDYPLIQAIEDRIIKVPLLVQTSNREQLDDPTPANANRNAYVEYGDWIRLALDRYDHHERDFRQLTSPNKPKPVLFIMCNTIPQAQNVRDGILKHYAHQFTADDILLVHSNQNGDISKEDENQLREEAQKIDESKSKVKIIISVMMLKEGWDVRNVTIILGLRSYSARSKILPEQTIGRGLRLMDPNTLGSQYTQVVELIGTKNFESFIKEIDDQDIIFPPPPPPKPSISIAPDQKKSQFDIEIPYVQSSVIYHNHISQFNVLTDIRMKHQFSHTLPLTSLSDPTNGYTGMIQIIDAVTGKLIATYPITSFRALVEIVNEINQTIISRISNPNQGSRLLPSDLMRITQEFLQSVYFSKSLSFDQLDQHSMRAYLDTPQIKNHIIEILSNAIGTFTQKHQPKTEIQEKITTIKLSEIPSFFWTKPHIADQNKCIFNNTPIWNNLEQAFALFLEQAPDVMRFSALAETRTIFNIPYFNRYGRPALYYPDFVVVQKIGAQEKHWIFETKGREDENVAHKDAAAANWCQKTTTSTSTSPNPQTWDYLKIPDAFLRSEYSTFFPAPTENQIDLLSHIPKDQPKLKSPITLESLIKKLKRTYA